MASGRKVVAFRRTPRVNEIVKKEKRLSQGFLYKRPLRFMVMGDLKRPPDEAPGEVSVVDLSNESVMLSSRKSKALSLPFWVASLGAPLFGVFTLKVFLHKSITKQGYELDLFLKGVSQ